MDQLWTITSLSDNSVLCPSFTTAGPNNHPKDAGWPWESAKHKATRISSQPDPSSQTFDGAAWVESPALIEPGLVAAVKNEAERRKMMQRSAGEGKAAEYRGKRSEAMASASVTASVLNALSYADATKSYPFASAEAIATGDKLATVLARYLVAAQKSDAEVARLSAVEWRAKAAIKAATTATAKRAAYGSIDWSWSAAT